MVNDNTLVIIGGDAAGMTAASKVRREHPTRKIIVFEKSRYTSYSACGIPYFISETIPSAEQLIVRSPEEFRINYNIDVRIMHKALEVDTAGKRIRVLNKERGEEFWQEYGQLLIATGGKPHCPDIPGHDAGNAFGITTLKSGIKLENHIEENKPRTAVIIGGGYIGLEMAEALLIRGLRVTLVNRGEQVMNTLDPDMGAIVSQAVRNLGVTLHLDEELKDFEVVNNNIAAVITDKRTIETDMVVFGMGSSPNTEFLARSGIAFGTRGAIKVNQQMQTNVPDVFAAGDCTETYHILAEKHVYIALGTLANKTGLVAGSVISGVKAAFPGAVGTAVCKICSYEVGRTGLLEKDLSEMGTAYAAATINSKTRAHYYPDAKDITVKLLAEKGTGRLLGGQIIGEEGAAKRIDVIATAITHGLTVQNLIDLDLSYAPPFSPVWDPVQTAARKLINSI